jgi:DNA adenine methylase
MLKPIVKYQGGKSKEIPVIRQYAKNAKRIIEPFAGGAAAAFYFEKPSVLCDINHNVINLYQTVANSKDFPQLLDDVEALKGADHDELEAEYYVARDYINEHKNSIDYDSQKAYCYIVLRQLCFSGMERYNSEGDFNVPFGHYKSFSCNLIPEHHEFLRTCELIHGSFEQVDIKKGDFVFIDPPYLERLGYTEGDGSISLHQRILEWTKNITENWLLIHSDHQFYFENYKHIVTNEFAYSQRFGKDKDHSNAKTYHLYISNRPVEVKFFSGTKEGLQMELVDIIAEAGLEVDKSIITKLTGKAAQYFMEVLSKNNS